MATVYLAADLKHDRRVALKILHPELAIGSLPQESVRAERLSHPDGASSGQPDGDS
jgi:hypothetical protein